MSQPNANLEEDLSALLDGELSPAEQAALEARLSEDPTLQAEYDALAEARAFLGRHGPVSAPDDLLGDILAAAEAEAAQGTNVVQMPFWQKPLGVPIAGWAVAAAALLVVYVALPTFDGGEPADTNAAARAPGSYEEVASWAAPKPTPKPQAEPAQVEEVAADDDAVAVVEQPELDQAADKARDLANDLKAPTTYGLAPSKSSPKDAAIQAKLEAEAKARAAAEAEANRKKEAPQKKGKRLVGEKEPAQNLEGGFAQVPYQYVLYTDDTEAIMQLSAIAGRYRGEIGAPNDQPLDVEELSNGKEATVVVKLPAHALQDFGRAIEGLGNVYQARDGRVFAGDPVEVRVKVQLAAGSGQADEPPPNAARQKQMMEADVLEKQ